MPKDEAGHEGAWLPKAGNDQFRPPYDMEAKQFGNLAHLGSTNTIGRGGSYGNKKYHQWETEKGDPNKGPRRPGPTERSPIAKPPNAAMESRGITLDFMKKHGPE